MLLAYDWHVDQVVCETRIIISYVFQTAWYQTVWLQQVTVHKGVSKFHRSGATETSPTNPYPTLEGIFWAIKYCQRNLKMDRILKQALDITTTHNYAVRKVRCRRPIIFGGGLQVPQRCVQQCNTLQQFSNSPKGVQDKFEDGLMKAQNCPKLSANCAG